MAAPPDEETLESRINKATNPLNKEQDWDSIRAFCEQLNKDLEGPQLATRLLAHKIQSPQEWEAMQALTVLETCMKNCGKRFHSEVGKFRFLNELIKVVSPKYLGTRAPEKVKSKVLELMYSWTVGLPDEVKISDAYQMLKKQGIVKQDPVLPDDKPLPPPPPRPKNAIFEDEEKSKMLARLLNSTHPEDLRAANKLIKEMVQEDQRRMERISKRVNAIEEVNSNVRLLTDLLHGYSHDTTTPSNEELIKELYQRCEKMRPTLFRLASDTEDNDEALAEILQANDNLTQVINMYKQVVKGEEVNGESAAMPKMTGSSSALLDLTGLDTSVTTPSYPAFPNLSVGQPAPPPEAGLSLLDDELMSLGLNDPAPGALSQPADSTGWNSFQSSDSVDTPLPAALLKPAVTAPSQAPPPGAATPTATPPGSKALEELEQLGKSLMQKSLPPENLQVKWDKQQSLPKPTLRDLQHKAQPGSSPVLPPAFPSELPAHLLGPHPSMGAPAAGQGAPLQPDISLANVTVPLESIKPSSILPVTVFDKHSFRVLFHFARDCPPSRPDVLVVVISMISTAPVPVRNIVFQSAVPKVMKVKLQPPSGTELPAFNPVVPPVAITQVLLLANPHKEKVRLRYKLTFTMGEETHNEIGDVEQFPPPENWGKL
ncbi:ADP-ribosylation factor-binding protein GGA1 isoform X2 [Lepisosteus oculatus]|uniref:ADP-ribosylation factor-binding protein GGA1 isoform X2 n=1 Tax=Lepisosteus oculatus TaxID=7918 RepID=UPI0035F517C8